MGGRSGAGRKGWVLGTLMKQDDLEEVIRVCPVPVCCASVYELLLIEHSIDRYVCLSR